MKAVWPEGGNPGVVWEGDEHGHNNDFMLARPHITRSTMSDTFGQPWCVWVPYTRPEHFDAPPPVDLDDWTDTVDNAPVTGPWGDTYWSTWQEAMEFLDRVVRDEPQHCPECRSSVRWEPSLGDGFLVCNGCAEILYPYELVAHASVGTCDSHEGLHRFLNDPTPCIGWVGV